MGSCVLCRASGRTISAEMGVCLPCLRERPGEALPVAREAHARSRAAYDLPVRPPRHPEGVLCALCVNECRIPEGEAGYCGIRENRGGRITGAGPDRGKVSWYRDPLPTNCVADWVCAGGTGAGFPRYARCRGPERGFANLAVFFHACSFDCLNCQNWQFRLESRNPRTVPAKELARAVDERVTCVCYFGGDPAPQLPYSLAASRLAREDRPGRILRFCWETNGSMHPTLMDRMFEMALSSGGCVKFDLKAWDETVHVALTGVSNARTLGNFARAAGKAAGRSVPPPLVASTLLVPGYVDEIEVRGIARFLASLDPGIPYRLLAFHPCFFLHDLPRTPARLAKRCLEEAAGSGLTNVSVGNLHLLA